MKYIKINELLKDTNTDNFQSYLEKLEFSKNFYKNLNELTEEELMILDEDCWNVLNDKISEKELEYQYNRYVFGYETRNYKEVAIMFQINKLFERLILIFMNRKYNLNLKVNPRSYSYTNSSVDPDFITLNDKIYYDLEGRTLNENNKIVIQFLEHKIKRNYLIHIKQNKQYYVIKYFIQGNKLRIGLININELYQKNLFYESGEHTKDGETVYRIHKIIKLDTYLLTKNKIVNEKEIDNMTRTDLNDIEYRDLRNLVIKNVKIRDVLNTLEYNVPDKGNFPCIFHNDTNPSASIDDNYNRYCCFSGCKDNFSDRSYWNVIELYSDLTGKDIRKQFYDICWDLLNISNIDISDLTLLPRKTNNTFKPIKNYNEIIDKYNKTVFRFKPYWSGEETEVNKVYLKKYFEARGIDVEKLKDILELNECKIGVSYSNDENYFYFDYGYKTSNNPTCIYRKINEFVNYNKYLEKLREIEEYNKLHQENQKKYIKAGASGFNVYHVLKTNNKDYYRNKEGKRQPKQICIFEGIMDALSFLDLSEDPSKYTIIVLNSVSNTSKLLQDILYSLDEEDGLNELLISNIYRIYTDTDKPGRDSFRKFEEKIKEYDNTIQVLDFDYKYGITKDVKDMNEYCIELKKVLDKQKDKK